MCRAITEAHAVDEVKDIRDKARAIEMYARLAQNTAAEQQAREIRQRAKCGQMTAQLPTAQGARTDLTSEDAPSKLAALRRASISRTRRRFGNGWQQDMFEQALAEPNPSTSGIITSHDPVRLTD
jgi:hypothetical protein